MLKPRAYSVPFLCRLKRPKSALRLRVVGCSLASLAAGSCSGPHPPRPPTASVPIYGMRKAPRPPPITHVRPTAEPIGVQSIAWSPDGSLLAVLGEDKRLHVWNIDTGELDMIEGELDSSPRTVTRVHNLQGVARCEPRIGTLTWDRAARRVLSVTGFDALPDERRPVSGRAAARASDPMAYQEDGTWIGSGPLALPILDDPPDELPDIDGCHPTFVWNDPTQPAVRKVAPAAEWTSPSGAFVSFDDHSMRILRAPRPVMISLPTRRSYDQGSNDVIVFSTDGRFIAVSDRVASPLRPVGDADVSPAQVHVYDSAAGIERSTLTLSAAVVGMAFSPDAAALIITTHDGATLYELPSGRQLDVLPTRVETDPASHNDDARLSRRPWITRPAFRPDRRTIAFAGRRGVVLWLLGASPPLVVELSLFSGLESALLRTCTGTERLEIVGQNASAMRAMLRCVGTALARPFADCAAAFETTGLATRFRMGSAPPVSRPVSFSAPNSSQ